MRMVLSLLHVYLTFTYHLINHFRLEMPGTHCSAIGCTNNRTKAPHLSYFRCPTDPARSKKWVINSRREDLLDKTVAYCHNNIWFCGLHFERNMFMNDQRNKLVWNAVPTVFDVPNPPKSVTDKRKPLKRSAVPVPSSSGLSYRKCPYGRK